MLYIVKERLLHILTSGTAFSVGAGLIAGTGFLVQSFWFLTPIGLGIFLYTLWTHAHNTKKALWYGTLFGFLVSGAGIFWFWSADPLLAGFGIPVNEKLFVIGVVWVYATVLLTLPIALLSPILAWMRNKMESAMMVVIVWILIEELRMWTFMFGTYLPGIALGPHFSIASLGSPLAEQPALLQLAYPFGLRALAGVSALFGTVVAMLLACRTKKPTPTLVLTVGMSLLVVGTIPFLYAIPPATIPPLTVALITTDVHENQSHVERATEETLELQRISKDPRKPDVIIFPEGFGLGALSFDRADYLARVFPDRDVLLIDSTTQPGTKYRELTYTSSKEGVLETHTKIVLTPVGEYIPPFIRLLSLPFHLSSVAEEMRIQENVARGVSVSSASFKGATIGALLCSELLSTSLYRELGKRGATILVNVANHEWFGYSRLLQARTVQLSKIHAVQNRSYFLLADSNAPSFAINPYGVLIASSKWGQEDVLYLKIPDTNAH